MLNDHDPALVKTALQRACELYEAGHAFTDPRFLEVALHRHLLSNDLKVRRWSYKLAGRLRASGLLPLLREQIDKERNIDAENCSWALAAYWGYAPIAERKRLVEQLDQEFFQSPLELASRFFSIGEPEPYRKTLEVRHLDDNPLTRKWLSMLAGYAATEPRTIHREFADLDIIRDFVRDEDQENVEYAIWAENRHPEGSYSKLRADPRELLEHTNVRRWLFQLLTKSEDAAAQHMDLLLERMDSRYEPNPLVREGLALGIARLDLDDFRLQTIEWYATEASTGVKLALVDHMARRAREGDVVALNQLKADYGGLDPHDLLALKIEAVADQAWLADVKATRQRTIFQMPKSHPGLFSQQPTVLIGEIHVDNSNRSITQHGAGSAITGVNTGTMIESTLNALSQNTDQIIADAVPQLKQFVRALEHEPIKDYEKQAAVQMVKDAIEAKTPEERTSTFAKLKPFVTGLLAAPGLSQKFIEDGQKLVETVAALLP